MYRLIGNTAEKPKPNSSHRGHREHRERPGSSTFCSFIKKVNLSGVTSFCFPSVISVFSDATPSHSTRLVKNTSQVAGYVANKFLRLNKNHARSLNRRSEERRVGK